MPDMGKEKAQVATPPHDKAAYVVFMLLGVGSLLSWNAFVTAVDYYQYYFAKYHPDRSIPVSYMLVNVLTTGLIVAKGEAIETNMRLKIGFWGSAVTMFMVPIINTLLVKDEGEGSGTMSAMALTLVFAAIIAVANGFVQGSLFGLCGPLPPEHTCAVLVGTAISGVCISMLRIITKASFGDTPHGLRLGTFVYFMVGGAYSLLCVFLHASVVPKLKVVRWQAARERGVSTDSTPLMGNSVAAGKGLSSSDLQIDVKSGGEAEIRGDQLMSIFWRLWKHAGAVFVNYWVTLSIFPGVLAEDIQSAALKSWFSLVLITVYNIADMIGKMVPEKYIMHHGSKLLAISFTRVVFIPTYAILVKYSLGDASFIIATFFLGVTNGYLTTCPMSSAPTLFEPKEAEIAGTMMVLFLLSGLTIGAFSGYLWLL